MGKAFGWIPNTAKTNQNKKQGMMMQGYNSNIQNKSQKFKIIPECLGIHETFEDNRLGR